MKSIWEYENDEQWAAAKEARAKSIHASGQIRVSSTPMPADQKFKPGTFVKISTYLGPSMAHFEKGRVACVQYTYQHAYGGSNENGGHQYSLLVRYDDGSWSSVAWYYESQLTEITDQELLKKLQKELYLDFKGKSD